MQSSVLTPLNESSDGSGVASPDGAEHIAICCPAMRACKAVNTRRRQRQPKESTVSMLHSSLSRLALLAVLACAVQPALAGEHNLEFKLITKALDPRVVEPPNVPGQTVILNKMMGTAYFKDGRVATKDFVFSADFNKGSGPFYGYSTYQFEDGSTLTARYAGTAVAGQPLHGEYTVISGTGLYASATGSGSFDATPHKLTGASLYNGKFRILTP
jgi:hypothetical protein